MRSSSSKSRSERRVVDLIEQIFAERAKKREREPWMACVVARVLRLQISRRGVLCCSLLQSAGVPGCWLVAHHIAEQNCSLQLLSSLANTERNGAPRLQCSQNSRCDAEGSSCTARSNQALESASSSPASEESLLAARVTNESSKGRNGTDREKRGSRRSLRRCPATAPP